MADTVVAKIYIGYVNDQLITEDKVIPRMEFAFYIFMFREINDAFKTNNAQIISSKLKELAITQNHIIDVCPWLMNFICESDKQIIYNFNNEKTAERVKIIS